MTTLIGFIHDKELQKCCNSLPKFIGRADFVQNLLSSYGLFEDNSNLVVVSNKIALEEDLKQFHDEEYINVLKRTECEWFDVLERHGLLYDCPSFEGLYEVCLALAGGSLTAANLLVTKQFEVVINWYGGWHHAQKSYAEGFCYINDVVLAIKQLKKEFARVLYVDLDVHHCNGVENAFKGNKNVVTLSFHKVEEYFYPGTGLKSELNCFNVGFKEGIRDAIYLRLFEEYFPRIFHDFDPCCLVVQCGADALSGDPLGECNLTEKSFGSCLGTILNCKIPTLFLGGGGYNFANTARLWCYLTAIIARRKLDLDIPETCKDFLEYKPTFELTIEPGLRKDLNELQSNYST